LRSGFTDAKEQGIHHDIAYQAAFTLQSFAFGVGHCHRSWSKQDIANVISYYAIDFFGHTAVEASEAGFHMRYFDLQFGGSQGTCQGGIGIAINDYKIRILSHQDWFQQGEDLRSLCGL
jgi:hypothetical protein